MPRRVGDYADRFADLNLFISISSLGMVAGTAIFFYNMIHSWARGPRAPWNPWRGRSLEWLVSSPPSLFNFDATPQVVGGPYQYGIPGARHAVVFAGEDLGGGELTETEKRTVIVVANRTIASSALIDQVTEKAADGLWRFTLVVPAEGSDHRAAERRMQAALAVLAERGIDASGTVEDLGPLEAVKRVLEEEPAQEIFLATFPTGESGWMDQDMVDRLRKASGLAVTRVIVREEDARAAVASAAIRKVAVVANDTLDDPNLVEAIRARADEHPMAVVLLCPLSLDGPGWTDDAERARDEATARARALISTLQDSGIQAHGEVIDGDPAEAARIARTAYSVDSVLLCSYRRQSAADLVDAVRAAAGEVTVEHVVVDAEAPAAPSGA